MAECCYIFFYYSEKSCLPDKKKYTLILGHDTSLEILKCKRYVNLEEIMILTPKDEDKDGKGEERPHGPHTKREVGIASVAAHCQGHRETRP